jgi:two-component system, chemotaxis family, sensor kinase CheA
VRIDVSKLDALLSLSGELRVTQIRIADEERELRALLRNLQTERRQWRKRRTNPEAFLERLENRLQRLVAQFGALDKRLSRDAAQLNTLTAELEDEVLGARLLSANLLFGPLERLVRDLSQQLGKRARLELIGGDVEMDRKIIEGVRDPLMHMIRNSLDHGLEPPEKRVASGKPEVGTIRLDVQSAGGTVTLDLSDDGAGIDTDAVQRRALERGLITADAALSPESLAELIFAPGFSTATAITETSGRGVGMDVVRENIRKLGGTVEVSNQRGHGSRFSLRVPAQLATTRVLLMRLGTQVVAIATTHVERTGRVRAEDILSVAGRQSVLLEVGGGTRVNAVMDSAVREPVPLLELGALLDVPFDTLERWQPFAVIRMQDTRLALTVDALLNEQEVVVKRLGYPLSRLEHLSGAAVLGSGRLVPILSAQHLVQRAARIGNAPAKRNAARVAIPQVKRYKVLVVDDSITTRTLERSILEASGFETRTAVNGAQALELLRREAVDLVLSDVEMPELDGFALTSEIRRDAKLAHLPVILVTSLDAPEHKERGANAGADAYIVKSEFDQAALLETIGRLL